MINTKQLALGVVISLTFVIALSFNACSQSFKTVDINSEVQPEPLCVGDNCQTELPVDSNVSPFKDALMTGDQLLRSIATIADVQITAANETALLAEYKSRYGSFASDYNPGSVNAPSVISTATVAGVFCEQGLTEEAAVGAAKKLMPSSINISAATISESDFMLAARHLAQRIWGRDFTANEENHVRQFFTEMQNANDTGAKKTAKDILRGLCAAMASSFDSISL